MNDDSPPNLPPFLIVLSMNLTTQSVTERAVLNAAKLDAFFEVRAYPHYD
jgi:hypothetical protein